MENCNSWLDSFHGSSNEVADDVVTQPIRKEAESESSDIAKAAHSIAFEERRYIRSVEEIDRCLPTQYADSIWLQCFSGSGVLSLPDDAVLQPLLEKYEGLSQADVDHEYLAQRAIDSGFTLGKWMLKIKADRIDDVWKLLATNLFDGSIFSSLVSSIKCSTMKFASRKKGEYGTICVYTNDGLGNKNAVMQIRQRLHEFGVDKHSVYPLFWKPDLYTYLKLKGATYVWVDGVDTKFWFDHWDDAKMLY